MGACGCPGRVGDSRCFWRKPGEPARPSRRNRGPRASDVAALGERFCLTTTDTGRPGCPALSPRRPAGAFRGRAATGFPQSPFFPQASARQINSPGPGPGPGLRTPHSPVSVTECTRGGGSVGCSVMIWCGLPETPTPKPSGSFLSGQVRAPFDDARGPKGRSPFKTRVGVGRRGAGN
ncbi:MAG: hypothetical protein CM15mP74_08690 [Halieaceae bacterium]|nr:MAG: hypothetical protein CM15mP74_08690 [Halieaceae bacterium]